MTETHNYGWNRSTDLTILTTLVTGFITWDILTFHFGFLVLTFGMIYTFISVPRNQTRINQLVAKIEGDLQFVTQTQRWRQLRPILYLSLAVIISLLAYKVSL